jgi:dTDP-glucose 4,6-dehydratase
MMDRIFVTGAGGFIGSHLVERLLRDGHLVRALVHYNSRNSWGNLEFLPPDLLDRAEVVLGDITDSRLMDHLIEGCDRVFHLAALIGIPYSYVAPSSYFRTNVLGTQNILDACRLHGTKRIVVTSTSEVYGTAIYSPIDEKHPFQGQSPYSASKIAADFLTESYYRSFDLPVAIIRPFNTYGPRQSARAIIPTVLSQLLAGSAEIRIGSLEPERDFMYISDTVEAFVRVGQEEGLEGETIHFGSGRAVSVRELVDVCLKCLGLSAKVMSEPERQRPEKSEVGLLLCDYAKAGRILSWSPAVALEEGIGRTADFVRDHLNLYRVSSYTI